MLDIQFIRDNAETLKKAAQNKNIDPALIDRLIEADIRRRKLLHESERLRAEKNRASENIAKLKGAEKESAIGAMKKVDEHQRKVEAELEPILAEFDRLVLLMPTPASPETPIGKDDSQNVEIKKVGEPPKFDFKPLDHVALGEKLDIIDIPRGVKVSGSRFYFLKNEGALLEMAVLKFTLDMLVKKGFTPFIPPVLVKHDAMMGTGYFPGGEEQAYTVGVKKDTGLESDEMWLIGTSEVPVTSYHSGEILEEGELPKMYAGISNCFRREAGTYGKDTHGLYRIHQFQKVEQVIISRNDVKESAKMHQMILGNAEEVLKALGLPYRVVAVCTGDMGQGQYYKNDIETWMPSRGNYGETHSCSTFHEFQARRLNLRYKTSDGGKQFCHTLNNTCIASPRILIPILENYQNADGSVTIPEALRPYMAGQERIEPKK